MPGSIGRPALFLNGGGMRPRLRLVSVARDSIEGMTRTSPLLTLSDAIKANRLADFVVQEEARGVGPASQRKLNAAIKKLATTPLKSEDQTSHSPCDDGSIEK